MSGPNPTERAVAAMIFSLYGSDPQGRAELEAQIRAAERTSPQTAAALRGLVRDRERGPQMN